MSMSSKAAPKTFNQLRNFTVFSIAFVGNFQGYFQKRENDALWDKHFRGQWAAKAAIDAEAARIAKGPPKEGLPEGVPEELGDLVRALTPE